jgi:hypothetical protein
MEDVDQWYVIPCPANVQLTSVVKERGTHGSIYCLWECERKTPCWIGQSIPALVRSINEKAVATNEKRLHASSLYRCLRREARKESHKNWKVEKFSRSDIQALNLFLCEFPSIVVTSKSPELWHCNALTSPDDDDSDSPDEASPAEGQIGDSEGRGANPATSTPASNLPGGTCSGTETLP